MISSEKELTVDLQDNKAILKHMLKTLSEKCDEEADNNSSSIPLFNKEARITYYTGLPYNVVEKLAMDKQEGTMLNLSSRILILNTIKGLCIRQQLPTFSTIFEETRNKLQNKHDQAITDYNEFLREMEILGYVLKETVNKIVIVMEDPEVRFERFMYLQRLKKFRSNSVQWPQIVYVDQRLVNLTQKFDKPTLSNFKKVPIDLEESIFYHAVSKTGYLTGLFSNKTDFNKWLIDILLVHLKKSSVIIMDTLNGPPENVISITRYHSKSDMLLWLTNNNIPCSSNMTKPALYELIDKCNEHQKEQSIDCIFKSQGHEVLRLPRHLFDLSMTTPLWNAMERQEIGTATSLMDLQTALLKKIASIPVSVWTDYENAIEKKEQEIFDLDITIENFCDMYEIIK